MKKNSLFKILPLIAVAMIGTTSVTSCEKENHEECVNINNTDNINICNIKWKLIQITDLDNLGVVTFPITDNRYWIELDGVSNKLVCFGEINEFNGIYAVDTSNTVIDIYFDLSTEIGIIDNTLEDDVIQLLEKCESYEIKDGVFTLYADKEKIILKFIDLNN